MRIGLGNRAGALACKKADVGPACRNGRRVDADARQAAGRSDRAEDPDIVETVQVQGEIVERVPLAVETAREDPGRSIAARSGETDRQEAGGGPDAPTARLPCKIDIARKGVAARQIEIDQFKLVRIADGLAEFRPQNGAHIARPDIPGVREIECGVSSLTIAVGSRNRGDRAAARAGAHANRQTAGAIVPVAGNRARVAADQGARTGGGGGQNDLAGIPHPDNGAIVIAGDTANRIAAAGNGKQAGIIGILNGAVIDANQPPGALRTGPDAERSFRIAGRDCASSGNKASQPANSARPRQSGDRALGITGADQAAVRADQPANRLNAGIGKQPGIGIALPHGAA